MVAVRSVTVTVKRNLGSLGTPRTSFRYFMLHKRQSVAFHFSLLAFFLVSKTDQTFFHIVSRSKQISTYGGC